VCVCVGVCLYAYMRMCLFVHACVNFWGGAPLSVVPLCLSEIVAKDRALGNLGNLIV